MGKLKLDVCAGTVLVAFSIMANFRQTSSAGSSRRSSSTSSVELSSVPSSGS